MRYRADIDGLRAIAVLPVVAFHLGGSLMSGGFIGVDVFFVISGYLIGSLILNDMNAGSFSLPKFYERRVRRILPALIFVLLTVSAASMSLLFAKPLYQYGQSLLAAAFSLSNFYFWRTASYFDSPSTTKPLLHTWSLAVEDQFYFIFPPFLLLARRFFGKHVTLCIGLVAIVSFALSVRGAFVTPSAAFYLPQTRAWELLAGGLLASCSLREIRDGRVRNGIAASGLALIAGPVFLYSSGTPFPGLAALPPCLGAVMIIAAGGSGDTIVGRVLSWKPVVFVGLISYSLYLWHWPVIVLFEQYLVMPHLTRPIKLAVVAVSFALSVLSWRFVEQPFRKRAAPRRVVFTTAAVAIGSVATVALIIVGSQGLPGRFTPRVTALAAYMDSPPSVNRTGVCFINSSSRFSDFNTALCASPSSTRPNVLLVGDSHAADLWYGLSKTLTGMNVMQANSSGCRPTVVHSRFDTPYCTALMDFIFQRFLPVHRVDLLVLAARWEQWDLNPMSETLDWAKGLHTEVLLLGPIAEYDLPLPQLLAVSIEKHDPRLPGRHILRPQVIDLEFAALAERKHVRYASIYKLLCPDEKCQEFTANGGPVEWDSFGHLTTEGSLLVAQRLRAYGVLDIPGAARP